jgi:hypothetical protein
MARIVGAMLIFFLVSGCFNWRRSGNGAQNDRKNGSDSESEFQADINPLDPPPDKGKGSSPTRRTLRTVGLEAMTISVPLGGVSRSKDVWRHVDETHVGAEQMLLFRRNGLRIGLGRPESFPPIKALLDALPGGVFHQPANLGDSVEKKRLELRTNKPEENQTVWYYTASGDLVGETYANCENILNVYLSLDPQFPNTVSMSIVPEFRGTETRRTWHRGPTGYKPIEIREGTYLYELAANMRIPADHFVIIGPSEKIHTAPSIIGARFLIEKIDGQENERVFVLTPRVQELEAYQD